MHTPAIQADFPGLIESEARFPGLPFRRDQIAAARDRHQHRTYLQREVQFLEGQIASVSDELARLRHLHAQIQALLARAPA